MPSGFDSLGHLAVREITYEPQLAQENFDVFIGVISWEARCLAARISLNNRTMETHFVKFASDTCSSESQKMLRQAELIEAIGVDFVNIIDLPTSREINASIRQLLNLLETILSNGKRIGIDISCLPKIYIQSVVSYLIKRKKAAWFALLYSQGRYLVRDGVPQVSHGPGEYVPVPFLTSRAGSSRGTKTAVVLGGESELFAAFTEGLAPDDISVIVPKSKDHPEISQILESQERKSLLGLRVRQRDVYNVEPFSFVAPMQGFKKILDGVPNDGMLQIFVAGPKPHAAAAALLAQTDRRIFVTARIPNKYQNHDVEFRGRICVCDVVNLLHPNVASLDIPF